MKSWESHSIVVTGGNGFLGSAIVALVETRHATASPLCRKGLYHLHA